MVHDRPRLAGSQDRADSGTGVRGRRPWHACRGAVADTPGLCPALGRGRTSENPQSEVRRMILERSSKKPLPANLGEKSAEFVATTGCVSAAPPGGSVRVVRWTTYTTRTPPRPLGPLLLDVAARAIWLVYAYFAPSSYTAQRLSADCGSEGRGFEPRRSPPKESPWGRAGRPLIANLGRGPGALLMQSVMRSGY